MYLFVLRFSADMDVDPRLILFLYDLDMPTVSMTDCHAVQPQIISALLFKSIGVDHIQHIIRHIIQLHKDRPLSAVCIHSFPLPYQKAAA